jgi:ParB/RepB/Spo0J family partition protein
MARELLTLNVKDLVVRESTLRDVDRKHPQYIELRNSVELDGILEPISVRKIADPETGDISYEIINGLQRYSACQDLGIKTIPTQVLEADDVKVLALQIQANLHRVDTKPAQFGKQLRRIMALDPSIEIADLAKKIAKSVTYVHQRLQLTTLDDNIAKLVDNGSICLSNALPLSKLPKEEQKNWAEDAVKQEPAEFVPRCTARVKSINDSLRKGKKPGKQSFTPVARLRRLSEIKTEMDKMEAAKKLCSDPKEQAGFSKGVEWVLNLDAASVKAAKEKFEAHKKEKGDRKRARREEIAKRKFEAAQKELQTITK